MESSFIKRHFIRMIHRWILSIILWSSLPCAFCANTSTAVNYLDSFSRLRDMVEGRLALINRAPPKYYPYRPPIYLSYEPLQIIVVDEVFQSLMISSAVTLAWIDLGVKWNPADYNGIDSLEIESDLFWTPSIYIPKTADNSVKMLTLTDTVKVSNIGLVSTLIPIITTTLCNLDLTFFPFDKHTCSIIFIESGMYNLSYHNVTPMGISSYFGTNAAWVLVSSVCYTQTSHYKPVFNYIVCDVEMSRRSAFYVVNLIGPMAMTSVITLVVFWLPAEGGEKMTFVVSMFLSSSVFYNYILDIMPRSMESPPRMNLLLVFNGLLIMLATAATAFVLRRYEQQCIEGLGQSSPAATPEEVALNQKHQPPERPKSVQLFYSRRHNAVSPVPPEVTKHNNLNHCVYEPDDKVEVKVEGKKRCCGDRKLTYEELDRIFFVLMTILTIVVWLLVFVV
ncbi:neuronal acetylcholine receptor subunit alpha-4-like [Physella acuta]|uniref:neuronal acetylcholine receptor subunit alpha-4-like n=1 Tax=Physella acuta TaxID=109671 RepID=UPI0027DE6F4D|nr:neuronal acetylcholine receptor subunit alpha-4-like [Physella acuta]